MRHSLPILALALLATACVAPETGRMSWITPEGKPGPELMFGVPDSDQAAVRLACDRSGTRLAVFESTVPRNTAAGTETFPTRLRLFFGNRETDIGAAGTILGDGNSLVEATLPDPEAFFAALERQGRLVAVTFAGRTKAPAPDPAMVAGFRTRCAGLG